MNEQSQLYKLGFGDIFEIGGVLWPFLEKAEMTISDYWNGELHILQKGGNQSLKVYILNRVWFHYVLWYLEIEVSSIAAQK